MNYDSIKILLVDDNKEFLEILKDHLDNQIGFHVVGCVHDGISACEEIKSNLPDIVILDIIMPRLDGLGVLENIKAASLNNPPMFLMLSAVGHESITQKAMALGAEYFLVKPFDLNILTERIRQLVLPFSTHEQLLFNQTIHPHLPLSPLTQSPLMQAPLHQITTHTTSPLNLETSVTKIIHDFGVPANIKGYQFLKYAIILSIENIEVINQVTKKLYPLIAIKFDTTPSRVDKAIRHAIDVAWEHSEAGVLDKILGYSANSRNSKPSNSNFIATVSDSLRMQMKAN